MSHCDTIKVLLVEDDADDSRLIAKQLRSQPQDYFIEWVETLKAATEKFSKHSFDVILTDLSLPDSLGLETVTRLRWLSAQVPIIVLTSLDDECVERDILKTGAQDYLIKCEFSGRDISRAILHAVQRQKTLNEMDLLVSDLERSQLQLQQQSHLLRQKNRRLRELHKTANEFVDNVSHDFRTPLTVIKDYVSIIREGMVGEINDEQQAMLDKVSVRADDLNNMVDDLLDVSKLESGLLGAWRRSVRVSDIIERAESLLRQRAQVKKVNLVVDCEADLPDVYCDSDKIGRVIMNLAVNAIKFAGEEGHVRLWAEGDPAGHQVVVGITDNGPGIDSESLAKIFKRFRQISSHAQPAIKGFGLGLSIARQLCELNLGEMSVKSQLGQGSTFSFTIPLADPREVLRRWLTFNSDEGSTLRFVEISIDERGVDSANEFDSFLNCLLRKSDVLFRTGNDRWILVMSVPAVEAERWFHRAEQEFARHNRNRPLGPLPSFRTNVVLQWQEREPLDQILEQFDRVVRQAAKPVTTE